MKRLSKILAVIICFVLTLSCVACSTPGGSGGEDNSNRTVVKLYVGGGGFGTKPYEEQAKRFREHTSGKSYEEGKMGAAVEVIPSSSATSITLNSGLLAEGYHIVGGSAYEKSIKTVADEGIVVNIDSIMRTPIPGEGNTTIIDKIPESQRWIYSVPNSAKPDGREYYGFPGVQSYSGLTYNKDLFDEKGFYLAAPDATEGVAPAISLILQKQVNFIAVEASKSVGPDGVKGTEDDGLPSSLYELIALCEKIKATDGIAPFMMLGDNSYAFYINYLADAIYASLLGPKNANAINEFKSDSMEVVVGFSNENLFPSGATGLKKPITQTISIDESCGYYVTHSLEKYYTYAFFQLMNDKEWYKDMGSKSHTDTQYDFIFGKTGVNNSARAGMLIECSYWYNESNKVGNFETFKMLNPGVNREIRWMSLPVNIETSVTGVDGTANTTYGSTESTKGENMVLCESGSGYTCINARYANDEVALEVIKDYLLFIFSDSELSKFSVAGCYTRPVEYDVDPADYADATSYVKSYFELTKNATIAYACGGSGVGMNNTHRFGRSSNSGFFAGNAAYSDPIRKIISSNGAEKCFTSKIIDYDTWGEVYFGGADQVHSYKTYPVGHPKAGEQIKFVKD